MKTSCIILLTVFLLNINFIFCDNRIKERFSETVENIKKSINGSRNNIINLTSKEVTKIRNAERKSLRRVDSTINDALSKMAQLEKRTLTFSPGTRQGANVCVVASRNTLQRLRAETKSRLRNVANVAVNQVLNIKVDVLGTLSNYLGLVNGLLVRFTQCNLADVGCYGEVLGEAANTLVEVGSDLPFTLVSIFGNISEIAQSAVGNIGGIVSALLTTATDILDNVSSCIERVNTGQIVQG